MINIKREITNPHTLYLTKQILYRTRKEKGLEAYDIMKRLVYVAYRMCGHCTFITYDIFLKYALTWLDREINIYEFMSLESRLRQTQPSIFGIDLRIVLKGTYGQIEQELLDKSKKIRETVNWISL